jgi:hypothetical protein
MGGSSYIKMANRVFKRNPTCKSGSRRPHASLILSVMIGASSCGQSQMSGFRQGNAVATSSKDTPVTPEVKSTRDSQSDDTRDVGQEKRPPPPPPPRVKLGLLATDLNCTFCHLEVHGTMASVGDVPEMRGDSNGTVYGDWLVHGKFNAGKSLKVTGKLSESYDNRGGELPLAADGKPGFPDLNFAALESRMQGDVSSQNPKSTVQSIAKVMQGNVVLIGSKTQPISIQRDILVKGDLVIAGVYTGTGTIYVTGNIYIPANLTALRAVNFPYDDDPIKADIAAKEDLVAGVYDALGLASAHNVFIADIEGYMTNNGALKSRGPGLNGWERLSTIYSADIGGNNDPLMDDSKNGVYRIYDWLPEARYTELYQRVEPCNSKMTGWTLLNNFKWGDHSFNRIDAYLYASKAVAGVARASSWALNGGMIARSVHIVSGAGTTDGNCKPARINFDYRVRNGLQILEALSPFFPAKDDAPRP